MEARPEVFRSEVGKQTSLFDAGDYSSLGRSILDLHIRKFGVPHKVIPGSGEIDPSDFTAENSQAA
jgi:hypothetical protein